MLGVSGKSGNLVLSRYAQGESLELVGSIPTPVCRVVVEGSIISAIFNLLREIHDENL